MKKQFTIGLATTLIMVPAFALAEGNIKPYTGVSDDVEIGVALEHRVGAGDINADGKLDVSARGSAQMNNGTDDDNDGVAEKRMDAEHRQDAVAKQNRAEKSTTTEDKGQGWGKGGIRSFLSFFFGLPASSTVGDIRAGMTATTSADTSKSQGLGFWARILGAFKFGN
jgi:hypothetical protein